MPRLGVNGVSIYYEQAGHGDPSLVLIHGNVASSRWWEPVSGRLAEQLSVVRLDLRGCGRSERPGRGHAVPQYSADVRELIRALGLEKVVLVGHSLGGSIAMDLVTSVPGAFQGLILINPAPAEGMITPRERRPLIEQTIRDRNLMRMALAAVIPTAAEGPLFEALVDDAMIAGPTMVPNYVSLEYADYRKQLAAVRIPTLIIYGTLDTLITLDMIAHTQEAIPGSELVLYEGIGHSPNVEAPERVASDIIRFVQEKVWRQAPVQGRSDNRQGG